MVTFSTDGLKERGFEPRYGDNGYYRGPKPDKKISMLTRPPIEVVHVKENPDGSRMIEYLQFRPWAMKDEKIVEKIVLDKNGYPTSAMSDDAHKVLFGCSERPAINTSYLFSDGLPDDLVLPSTCNYSRVQEGAQRCTYGDSTIRLR
jgi:hypothetical protein